MLRSLIQKVTRREAGQALPLFGLFLFVFIGFVAMSIDVGRYVWARTQMQAAVDASALAAAQSMPSQTDASAKATEYWIDNSGFIQAQGTNVQFSVEYPPGNKAIRVSGSADIPTWFARLFGVDKWHVSASGDAESQVLDIAVVLDISGSMCYDTYPKVEASAAWMGPGRSDRIPALRLAAAPGDTTLYLESVDIFNSTSSSYNASNFGPSSSSRYHQQSFGGRSGTILLGNPYGQYELITITGVNGSNNSLTVTRARQNKFANAWTSAMSHPAGAEVWANHNSCARAAPSAPNGPFQPYDGMVDSADYFTTLFDSVYDKIGVAEFSTQSSLNMGLSSNLSAVRNAVNTMSVPNGGTNIAHGLAVGRQILDGSGKRANAVRVLVLLTDGLPTNYCGSSTYAASAYNSTSCSSNSNVTYGEAHAQREAERAAAGGIIIFTIGLGYDVDASFLEDIATTGGGSYYFAPTTAQLDEAFKAIAEQTHIALVR